ncbi:hypothetical protein CEK25_002420 [Fusarium fujikuroi]|nr:hypothetical protein CEK25_002420 [Fusarium fujikuroi]
MHVRRLASRPDHITLPPRSLFWHTLMEKISSFHILPPKSLPVRTTTSFTQILCIHTDSVVTEGKIVRETHLKSELPQCKSLCFVSFSGYRDVAGRLNSALTTHQGAWPTAGDTITSRCHAQDHRRSASCRVSLKAGADLERSVHSKVDVTWRSLSKRC